MSAVLEVAVGLAFLFSVLSLLCSAVNELIAAKRGDRGRTLERAIARLLDSDAEAAQILEHPLIQSLYLPGRRPSYIPSAAFAMAAVDRYAPDIHAGGTPGFDGAATDRVRHALALLWADADGDPTRFRRNVARWFDDTMERASGWYRRRAETRLLVIAAVVTVALNVNTIGIVQRLWTDAPVRAAVAAGFPPLPTSAAGSDDPARTRSALERLDAEYRQLDASGLPLGWSDQARPRSWPVAFAGWVLTVAAVSLGAPFWFDLLGKVSTLRSSGEKPAESK
ncbi:MAG TPA: hypothetical protein VL337_12390 [Acidimicrobiales bacterium]|nr:hypothetical protein [Acidimicrobiales bacterium]